MDELITPCITEDGSELVLNLFTEESPYWPHAVGFMVRYQGTGVDHYSALVDRHQLGVIRKWLEQAEQLLLKEENK